MGAMDNVGEGHVRGLAAIAQSYVAEDETRLQAVCDALRELAPVAG
jgi:hypothetical protein